MNIKRLLLGLWLLVSLAGCNLPGTTTPTAGSPSPTLPPGVTPTVTPTTIPSPTPTPTPAVRVASGDQALFNGDFTRAREEYRTAFNDTTDPVIRAEALWGLGRVEYEDGNYPQTLDVLRELVASYGDSHQAGRAYFLLGETYQALDRYQEAATSYSLYLSLTPGLIDSHVQERLGDVLSAAGSFPEAVSAYQAALAAPHLGDAFPLQVKLASAFAEAGDSTTAFGMYDDIASRTSNDYLKAQMDLLAGQLHQSLGQTDLAYQRFQHAVDNYPLAYDSYSALVALVSAGIPVDELNRGLVDYFAGQYGYALEAFDRYLATNPENDGTVHHYRALTLRSLDEYEAAVAEWTLLIDKYPGNNHLASAWDEKAYTQWYYLGQYEAAAQTLLTYVFLTPADPNVPLILMEAGRIQERGGFLREAAQTWERIANEYSSSDQVPQALFWAGIVLFRAGDVDKALVTFQRDLLLSTTPEDQARANFWIGKMQLAKGDSNAAQETWRLAANLDPTGYYSERARDMLLNRPIFDPPPAYNLTFNPAADRKEAEAWIRITFNLASDTNLSQIGALGQEPRLVRGTELWSLGLYDDARLEFEDLRQAVSADPADSYRLANYLLDLGLYRPAIFAARQVLTLAGLDTSTEALAAPNYFNHVRFGTYFSDLTVPAAQEKDFHPLLLFSILRQESMFEGFVHSGAGARGLMQIIPSTGQTIAENLGWTDFTPDDLYRPMVSIQFGAHYLKTNRSYFNGDLVVALAAYNAGPTSAEIWNGLSGGDADLFVEIVRFSETRSYIRNIYENFVIYRSLYGTVP